MYSACEVTSVILDTLIDFHVCMYVYYMGTPIVMFALCFYPCCRAVIGVRYY